MRKCLDDGVLQSYFDGELSSDRMESVTSHLASCLTCSLSARELESENNLLATALEPEFDLTVPTERLRHRIDAAVAGLQVVSPVSSETPGVRSFFQSLSNSFSFLTQRAFAYATLGVVLAFATIFALVQWRQTPSVSPNDRAATAPKGGSNASAVPIATPPPEIVNTQGSKSGPDTGTIAKRNRQVKPRLTPDNQGVARVKLMPGERSYLKTIAALDSTIKSKGSRPMRPALQAEYETNLALVDRALAATRTAAKNNPSDPDAAEFMFAAYQSKVDLLNTVADARLYNRER